MPGWYIHMESAKKTADRLRAGNVPPSFPGGVPNAQALGELCYKWRNYLAAGAIGPDIFFLLPDFKGSTGNVLLTFVRWFREVFEIIDEKFMAKWEKWAEPALTGVGDVLNQISGGMLQEIGQALQELAAAIKDAIIDLIAQLWDWFGILTSGVPKGYADSAFFWSDMFHYRKTYAFARRLFELANANGSDQQKAFAVGWMSHCATDVTGHSFVNEKCGGPFRLHWQRHHLVENHMDALVYDSQHGAEPYGELDTSALHFRLAFRKRNDSPYNGAEDAPAYDYFAGFPAYDPSDSAAADFARKQLWDLDTGDLPEDLCQLIIQAMKEVYGDVPKILTDDPAEFRDGNSGRPNVKTIQDTYWTLYHYVKMTSTGGYSPRKPSPPSVLNDHSPPAPPGSDAGVSDDPTRGDDPDESDDFNLLDLFLALFGWILYIAELGVWLATLPIAVINDILTYPAREILYEFFVVPMWNLYMAARRPLVMSGFLMPKHEEIMRGLVELGISPTGPLPDLAAALASPDGTGTAPIPFDEPSGRSSPADAYGADKAFPRAVIQDNPTVIANIVKYLKPDIFCGLPKQPSEFLRPWKYPELNNANETNGWEAALTHPGPWLQGQDARALIGNVPGDATARNDFENATTPEETEARCDVHLPFGRHLGDPVDYSVYLVGALTDGKKMPDFNLDADRGYAYHCWDWNRKPTQITPDITGNAASDTKYNLGEPCTIPEQYCEGFPNSPHYDPFLNLAIHYRDDGLQDPGCQNVTKASDQDIQRAGMTPDGKRFRKDTISKDTHFPNKGASLKNVR